MRVFIGTPTHDGRIDMGTHTALLLAGQSGIPQMQQVRLDSLITSAFNKLWVMALNMRKRIGVTHFCMVHADVVPIQRDWLNIMVDEITATGADVVSAVIPIKNQDGLTTTALDVKSTTPWSNYRLSMHEVMQLPETFDANDAYSLAMPEYQGERFLLPNTGLFIADITKKWAESFCFTLSDTIFPVGDDFDTKSESEDWNMGRYLHDNKLKVMATRKVKLNHVGRSDFVNYASWGKIKSDNLCAQP